MGTPHRHTGRGTPMGWHLVVQVFVMLCAITGALATAIPVNFTTSSAGYVTLVIEDSTGVRVRNLVSGTYFPAGSHTVYWDGLNEQDIVERHVMGSNKPQGRLVPTGTYTVRGLVRNAITPVYEFTVDSTGTPPWPTSDHKGGWLGDQAPTLDIAYLPVSSKVTICSGMNENNDGLIWTNTSGTKTNAIHVLAYDARAHRLAYDRGPTRITSHLMYAGTGALWCAGDGDAVGIYRFTSESAHDRITYRQYSGQSAGLRGLAAWNGLLVAMVDLYNYNGTTSKWEDTSSDKILFINATTGSILKELNYTNARGCAFDNDGHLLAISGTTVNHYVLPADIPNMSALPTPTVVASSLDAPRALTVDSANNIYVSLWGASNYVRVYQQNGSFIRAIGTSNPGNEVGATYDQTKMFQPSGLAIVNDGGTERLWVAEFTWVPKSRVSVWTLTGTFVKQMYGENQFGSGGKIDPQDKTKFYSTFHGSGHGQMFTLDWNAGAASPGKLYASPINTAGGPVMPDNEMYWDSTLNGYDPRPNGPETPIYYSGRKYMTNLNNQAETTNASILGVWLCDPTTEAARGVAIVGSARSWDLLRSSQAWLDRWAACGVDSDPSLYTMFSWSDTDFDGAIEPSECTFINDYTFSGVALSDSLEATYYSHATQAIRKVTPTIDGNGVPVYNIANATTVVSSVPSHLVATYATAGLMQGGNNWVLMSSGPLSGYQSGTLKWTYPSRWPNLSAAQELAPLPSSLPDGSLIGTERFMGKGTVASGDAGEIFALYGQRGQIYLFTVDGLYIATLFNDARVSSWNALLTATRGMDLNSVAAGESSYWSTMTRTSDGNFYLVTGHPQASIVRVNGLTSVSRFTATSVTVTTTTQTDCVADMVTTEHARQVSAGDKLLQISEPTTNPVIDGYLSDDWTDAKWVTLQDIYNSALKVEGALAIVNGNLYGAIKTTTSESGLLNNAWSDYRNVFRTGGGIDLYLGTDATASSSRTSPVVGDLRVIFAKPNGVAKATLFRELVGSNPNPVVYGSGARTTTLQRVDDISTQVAVAGGTEGNNNTYEFMVPLSALGMTATHGNIHLGDLGILRSADDAGQVTQQRLTWNNQTQGVMYDDAYEAKFYPGLWGQFRVGTYDPKVTLTNPTDNQQVAMGGNLTMTANVLWETGRSINKVEFLVNGNVMHTITSGSSPYSYTWTNVPWGSYSVTVRATDDQGAVGTSAPADLDITGGVISPLDLACWYKAGNASTRVDSQNVGNWYDASGRNHTAGQGTGTAQPIFRETAFNGRPALEFSGGDHFAVGSTAMLQSVGSMTAIAYASFDNWADSAHQTLLSKGPVGQGLNYVFGKNDANRMKFTYCSDWWHDVYESNNYAATNGQPTMFAWVVNKPANTVSFYVNGTLQSTVSDTANLSYYPDTNYMFIGAMSGGFQPFNGDIGEMLLYKRALTGTELSSVYTYLTQKYSGALKINCGGGEDGYWFGDYGYTTTGGGTDSTGAEALDLSGVTNPAPYSVYQTGRYGDTITYTANGLTPAASYTVRLHFLENYFINPGQRVFNVAINGTTKLSNYDILAEIGVRNKATLKEFIGVADANGRITIAFTNVVDKPRIQGIEIIPGGSEVAKPVISLASGRYASGQQVTISCATTGATIRYTTDGSDPTASSTAYTSVITLTNSMVLKARGFKTGVITSDLASASFELAGTAVRQINCGGAATGTWSADSGYNAGTGIENTGDTIDTSQVTSPAPQSACQTARYKSNATLTYTISDLVPNASYTVRLHFVEQWFTSAGARAFDVNINSTQVLNDFDIWATAYALYGTSGHDKALVEQRTTTSDANGVIVLDFIPVTENPKVNGIEILVPNNASPTCSLTAPTNGASFGTGNITLTASASDSDGTISNVEFYQGTTLLGTDSTAPYSYTWACTTAGSYSLTAKAYDNMSGVTTSSAVAITVADQVALKQINCGGSTTGNWLADTGYNGGTTEGTGSSVNTSMVTNPAPQAVYQSARYITSGNLTYTVSGLNAGASYTVRLHFMEQWFSSAGQRVFNININGTQQLANFDIWAAANTLYGGGGQFKAVLKEYTATANASGQIVIDLVRVTENPKINGIEIWGAEQCATPTFSVAGGTYTAAQSVTLSSSTGATIRYTTDGSDPTSSSTPYTSALSISSTTTLKAKAFKSGALDSGVATAIYTFATVVQQINCGGSATGTWSADSGYSGGTTESTGSTIDSSQVSNPAPQAVYQCGRYITSGNLTYTMSGLTAGNSYAVRLHFNEQYFQQAGQRVFNINVNGTQQLANFDVWAAANTLYGNGGLNKAVVKEYTATANGSGQIVIDFVRVTENPKVNGIEVLAINGGGSNQVATPTFTPAGGTYSSAQSVAMACATSGATIRYTSDGSEPTSSSTAYSSPLSISTNTTVKAKAFKSGMTDSATGSATYTFFTGLQYNCGGSATGSWSADSGYTSGSSTESTGDTIDTSQVSNPAPTAVYQCSRYHSSTLTYTIGGLNAGSTYNVRLHFIEQYFQAANQRKFHIDINGTRKITDFDIWAEANTLYGNGGHDKAIVKEYTATANSSGQIIIDFSKGSVENPKISGIEILP